ncbi:MAG: SDR family oxidoreductase [Promethearchaeota archaeon]
MNNGKSFTNYKKRILIIGANGFLGKNLLFFQDSKEIRNLNYLLIAGDLKNNNIPPDIPYFQMDITNQNDINKKIRQISPEIIILTAAFTNVDECEVNKNLTKKVNVDGVINIIHVSQIIDCKLIFMSTDFVFDGTKKQGLYSEEDIPHPINFYGKTKYEAELHIINSGIDFLICRAAVLYGWNQEKLNFITWILNNLKHEKKISIVSNQINNPTFVRNLAQILFKLIEKDAKGIFHTAGDDVLSRYNIAVKCAEIFNYDQDLITPVEKLHQTAIRPENAGLNITKLKKFLGPEFRIYNLDDGLTYMKNNRIN